MSEQTLRTAEYDEARRWDLARAVKAARMEAFRKRSDFLRAHPDVKPTSLYLIEHAKPLVGRAALEAVGEALGDHFDGWSKKTPEKILEGEPAPPLVPKVISAPPRAEPVTSPAARPQIGSDEWLLELAKVLDVEYVLEIRLLLTRYWKAVDRNAELEERIRQLEDSDTQSAVVRGQR